MGGYDGPRNVVLNLRYRTCGESEDRIVGKVRGEMKRYGIDDVIIIRSDGSIRRVKN